MSENTFDADWLFGHEARRYDAFGQRESVGSLVRWQNLDNRRFRDANHAAILPGSGASRADIDALLELQANERADRCIDVYGTPGEGDQLCLDAGLERESNHPVLVMAWSSRSWEARALTKQHAVESVPAEKWCEVQMGLHPGGLEPWGYKAARAECGIPSTAFYAVRFNDRRPSALLRHDWDDISQIETVFTHFRFRERGLAKSCLAHALAESPHSDVYLVVLESNLAAVRLYLKAGADIVASDLVRRYVG